MKLTVLQAIGHNIAHSLASGMGFMIGTYLTDVFGEAKAGAPAYVEVNFVNGAVTGAAISQCLKGAVELYRDLALPKLCAAHRVDYSEFQVLTARYSVHPVYGPEYLVTVEATGQRKAVDLYVGYEGRRLLRRTR
jgi:hypothetical protein